MAMRSKFFVAAFGTFLLLSVDPVAAARLGKAQSEDDSEWLLPNRCARLQRTFNRQLSRVQSKVTRANEHPGAVSTASLVVTLRGLTRSHRAASNRECAWVSEQGAESDTMVSIAHENLDGNPCLPQAQELMTAVDQSDPDAMSIAAVQAVGMLISGGNCTAAEIPTEAGATNDEDIEDVAEEAMLDVETVAFEVEDEQADGSALVEQDVSLEQKLTHPHHGHPHHPHHPHHPPHPHHPHHPHYPDDQSVEIRAPFAVRALSAIVLVVLSLGFLCAAGPAIIAFLPLIALSIIVLFLAFFWTFISVAFLQNPGTGTQWLFTYLASAWGNVFGRLATTANWASCYAYLTPILR